MLLEGGDEQPFIADVPGMASFMIGSNLDYGYLTQPENKSCGSSHNRCYWPRGKVMGGSGSLFSTHFVRGNKWDYDYWSYLGNVGWNWANVLQYFKKMEDFRIPEVSLMFSMTSCQSYYWHYLTYYCRFKIHCIMVPGAITLLVGLIIMITILR